MRYVTYVLTPQQGYFDLGEENMREHGVIPQAVHDIDFLTDDTIVQQIAVQGAIDDIDDCFVLDADRGVIDYQVSAAGDTTMLQLHYHPSPLVETLLTIHRRHAVILDFPLEYVGPGQRSLRVSEVGHEDELRSVIEETRDTIDVEIEGLGSYDPSVQRLFSELTDRQREVLHIAVEEGYYEVPRRVTYEDIAEYLGCSAGAIGQHLRRIEAQLMNEVVGETDSLAANTAHPE